MSVGSIWLHRVGGCAAVLVLSFVLLLALAATGIATAQTAAQESATASLDPIKSALDTIEAGLKDNHSNESLAGLKGTLAPLRDSLRGKIDDIEPRLGQVEGRLKQLGPPPAGDAPPEEPTLAAERARLVQQQADLASALKQARLLSSRADDLADRINDGRRAIFAHQLFTSTKSVFDPAFWGEAAAGVPGEMAGLEVLLRAWWNFVRDNGSGAGAVAAAISIAALVALILGIDRWWRGWAAMLDAKTAFGRARAALLAFLRNAAAMPVAVGAILLVLDAYGLVPGAIRNLGIGLIIAVAVASFGRAAAVALCAPAEPGRRLMPIDDARAGLITTSATWSSRALGLTICLNILHKTVAAPIALTVATSALFGAAVTALVALLLLRVPKTEMQIDGRISLRLPWLRGAAWLFVAATTVSLGIGYVGFGAFLAGRLLTVLAVAGALYIALRFVDSLFSEVLTGETERGRSLAAALGLTPRGLELAGTLLSAVIRLLLVFVAIFPVLGPWGIFAADVVGAMQDYIFGFRIGDVTISLRTILGAFALLFIGVLATRAAQRWLETRFLPRTGIDPGLQHSVSTLFGYGGVIAALAVVLAELGIDLQKIAIVAGALSVGIGFGLQSIVSNFVSGLILLAERPIRVGDWVVVKNDEGFVRRISVRATEIETFDRASVIVPNSELVTGVVKNWTHANTLGRITVKVGVAYDSDVDEVRDILMSVACDHPQVLQTPAPSVFLLAFGDNALEFELRCIVSNVQYALVVKSDLHFAVLHRFRKAGIEIPYPQREVRVLGERTVARPNGGANDEHA
jgi:potassium efflux system protein